jgi:hypothetical protein
MLPAPSDLARWRAEMHDVFGGPNQTISWLEPVWHGDVGRVVLYQMVPPRFTSPALWGADQRIVSESGREMPDPRFRVMLDPRLLSPEQIDLYLRYGVYGQPYWIVEGHTGGHKRRFTALESRLLLSLGHSGDAPVAGSQPYAPIDLRVYRQLVKLDQAQTWAFARALNERDPAFFDREERDALEAAQRNVESWLMEQVGEAFDDYTTYRSKPATDALS